jgi:rhodanese-related sulfurtransferase
MLKTNSIRTGLSVAILTAILSGCTATQGVNVSNKKVDLTPISKKKQTKWGLYINAQGAYEMETESPDTTLFLDVRTPEELLFTGNTNVVDFNIPFKFVNNKKWNDKKGKYEMPTNRNFAKDVERALKLKNMSKEDDIVIMCRSGGSRGAPAAKLLEGKGYKNVWIVVDGFEGETLKTGDKKKFRLVNGWKNAKLPWGQKNSIAKEKMYFNFR